MSRETDSSSSGPHGRGGPSYAPGTEPYGNGVGEPSERPAAGADAQAPADEPKTETTLTTRIRINIPGSRPIPPVVMRKPVGEGDEDSASEHGPATGDASNRPGPGAGSPGGSAAGSGGAAGAAGAGGAGAAGAAAGTSGASGPGGGEPARPTSDWFAPRKPPRPAPEPEPEPDQGRTATPPDGFPAAGGDTAAGLPRRGGSSDLLDGPPPRPTSGAPSRPAPGAPPGSPAGRTTGPQAGDMPVPPPPGGRNHGGSPAGPPPGPSGGYDPFGRPVQSGPPPGPSLYSQGPGGGESRGDEPVASDTLVSGIPRVPSVDSVFPPDAPAPKPSGHGYFDDDRPGVDDATDRGDRDEGDRQGKGRSKLVLAAVGAVGIVAVAYGAGLLLDHADVPKGTTVLGVDIGGKTQQDAVNTLDAALESRMTDQLTLVVNGKEKQVTPEVLGLTIDTEETVREASGRDYNPVSVIGSLFGGSRVVEAQVQVDDEKLRSAVADQSQQTVPGAAAAKDGMVVFTGGQAKVVPGAPHKAVDVNKAAGLIENAYRERAATGRSTPVTLPVSTQQPQFSEQELQAAAEDFGKNAMSGWVWVRAGDVELPFSEKTIGTFLTMTGEESLQPTVDLDKLAAAYGTAFDGVVVDGGAGAVPVQPKHVAAAMVEALRQPAPTPPEKRVAEVTGSRSQ